MDFPVRLSQAQDFIKCDRSGNVSAITYKSRDRISEYI